MDYILLPRGLIVAKMVDVEVTEHVVQFRIEGEGYDFEDREVDFWSALEDFKKAMPAFLRRWTGDEWVVEPTEAAIEILAEVFSNAGEALDDVEPKQLDIWS